jgi:protein dithiol:quinone oxidoreductase
MPAYLTPRTANLAGFLLCCGLMGYALYAQHVLGLEPCPLCIFQRVAVIALGAVFLLAALHNPGPTGRRVYAALLLLVGLAGSVVAGRHLWLQTLPPEKVPACGPGLDFLLEAFPLQEALQVIFAGSGECAKADWSFLGIAMPGWVLISIVALVTAGVWLNSRSNPPAAA